VCYRDSLRAVLLSAEVEYQLMWVRAFNLDGVESMYIREPTAFTDMVFVEYCRCAPTVVKFIEACTTHIEGVGDVCSYALFDFQHYGDQNYMAPVAPEYVITHESSTFPLFWASCRTRVCHGCSLSLTRISAMC